MKLRVDGPFGFAPSGVLAGLGLVLAAGSLAVLGPATAQTANGPAADYPIVLGAPYTIDGVTYTPADRMNLDQVGYAVIDTAAGSGISIAHRTLPLPSYAEVTSLRTGRTILVRVERRGPPSGNATIALSPAAAAQLGTTEARTPIRVRRVNPPEPERALLRAGQPAPARLDTPMGLVAVLMRKLDPAAVPPAPVPAASPTPAAPTPPAPAAVPASQPVAPKKPAVMPPQLKPALVAPTPAPAPQPVAKPAPEAKPAVKAPVKASPKPAALSASAGAAKGQSVVQVGAYASRASADKVAAKVGGTVSPAGKLFRVRIGGLATPQAAAAALAKAKGAGYSEARIQHAD